MTGTERASTARIENPTLTVGIPAGRPVAWTRRILAGLDVQSGDVTALVARSGANPLSDEELADLNTFLPTQAVHSKLPHAPAMRNAILQEVTSSHVLFLDDDMVPGKNLLATAQTIAADEPGVVHQGVPYRVANSDNWLARAEGSIYERGYKSYIAADDTVSVLDARLMLGPTDILQQTPFDESLVFGGGEGRELARDLIAKGVVLKLARELDAAHINRDSIREVAEQKIAHGRGRGHELLNHGPGEKGWQAYVKSYAKRHYIDPALKRAHGEIGTEELLYIWGTNTVLWAGVFEYMLRNSAKSHEE